MKKWLIIFVVIFLFLAGNELFAKEQNSRNIAIEVNANPIGFLVGIISAGVEIKLSKTITINPEITYVDLWWLDALFSIQMRGIAGALFFNYYYDKTAMKGFYLGPKVSFGFASTGYHSSDKAEGIIADVGARVGYQWIFENGFLLDLNAGYSKGLVAQTLKENIRNEASLYGGLFTGLNVGFAF